MSLSHRVFHWTLTTASALALSTTLVSPAFADNRFVGAPMPSPEQVKLAHVEIPANHPVPKANVEARVAVTAKGQAIQNKITADVNASNSTAASVGRYDPKAVVPTQIKLARDQRAASAVYEKLGNPTEAAKQLTAAGQSYKAAASYTTAAATKVNDPVVKVQLDARAQNLNVVGDKFIRAGEQRAKELGK